MGTLFIKKKLKNTDMNVVKLMSFSELLYGKSFAKHFDTENLLVVLQQMTIKLLLVFFLINYTTESVLCASHQN